MSILKEFKEFAVKGDAVDMAVGIVIGAAFGKIVTSLVNDIIMPPIGLLIGGVDFKDLQVVIKKATETSSEIAIRYGAFVNTIIDFVIIAAAIFLTIKLFSSIRKKKEEEKKEEIKIEKEEVVILKEIRDLLKKK